MDVHILGNFKFYYKHEVDAHIERYKAEIAELKYINKTVAQIKQDAIREMYEALMEAFPFELQNKHRYFIKEYADNLEK